MAATQFETELNIRQLLVYFFFGGGINISTLEGIRSETREAILVTLYMKFAEIENWAWSVMKFGNEDKTTSVSIDVSVDCPVKSDIGSSLRVDMNFDIDRWVVSGAQGR